MAHDTAGSLTEMSLPHDLIGHGQPPVLLIPGANGHRLWMSPLAKALAPHHRTAAFTLPGESEAPALGPSRREASFQEIVHRGVEVMDTCDFQQAVVVGTSFGGLVAMHMALAHPERVTALVLHATTARPRHCLKGYRWALFWPALAVAVFDCILATKVPQELYRSFDSPSDRRRFLGEMLRLRRNIPLSVGPFGRRLRQLRNLDLTPRLPEIKIPTLVLSGEPGLDRITPAGEGEWIASRIPGAEYRLVDRTGHLAVLTRPDLVAGQIRSFLTSRDLSPT